MSGGRATAMRMRLQTDRLVALVVLASVPCALLTSASGDALAQPIHACVSTANGALRIGKHCRAGERAITWGRAGGAGAQGPIGPRGPAGLEGRIGPSGVTGETGRTGPAAGAGVTGPAGPVGASGATGAKGVTGAAGAAGAAGATGPTGATGATGATGLGSQGPPGPSGPSGAAGPAGPSGPTGPSVGVLATGSSESGTWIADSPVQAEVPPHGTAALISFPIPLAVALGGESHAHYVNPTVRAELETTATKTVAGCKTETTAVVHPLETPVAEVSGNLCVYAGVAEFANAKFSAILNVENTQGVSRTGATVLFEVESVEIPEAKIRAQGTWAVKG
jgi:hypothetical protein